ncbi:hypothetical protein [Micromonospora sp. NPDC047074]|uniref:hypothetical protein n=1 Tax=Micromonospora sp. NPDC047074 TaxID=3154339 RepID=UPI0033E68A75
MAKFLSRPRVRGLIAATAVAGGVVLGTATPAYADYDSPTYATSTACNAARPAYVTSWTSPGPCYQFYFWNGGIARGWKFTVFTR